MFSLVDCNNFYCSCERLFNPGLLGKPIVVLSNNDGCVISRSDEAKALGIPMGAVTFMYEELFEKHDVRVFSSNYSLYGNMSHRVMSVLQDFSPEVEVYSIDETFLKLNGFEQHYDLNEYGKLMRRKVLKWTGIPTSVGTAKTKALAKLANKIAKKFPAKTGNVYVIDTEEKRIKACRWLAIEDVWGIGSQHATRLKNIGVHNAYDFTQLPDSWIQKHMSIVGLRLKRELEGIPTLDLEDVQDKKNIATTRAFASNITEYRQIKERVATYTASAAQKLRKQNSCCNAMIIFLHTNQHRHDQKQYYNSITIKTEFSTNSTIELVKTALKGLERIFKSGFEYKKAGIILLDIVPEHPKQLKLFRNEHPKHAKLMQVLDKINKNSSDPLVRLAIQDKRKIKMRQEKLSPCYTTKLVDLMKINCL